MKREDVCILSDADFKRAIGVQRDIFDVMLEELKKNSILEFIMESANQRVCRTIKKIEDALIKSEIFHLFGGKNIVCGSALKAVQIDASEQPVERPKKEPAALQRKEKTLHAESSDNC